MYHSESPTPRRLLRAFAALALILAPVACSDEISHDPPPDNSGGNEVEDSCDDVVCGDNASCDENTLACVCDRSYLPRDGACVAVVCAVDADCDDGLVCNGTETCDTANNRCIAGEAVLCGGFHESCEEPTGACVIDPEASACLLISSTDWMTSGSLSVYDLEKEELLNDVTTYAQDAILRVIDGEVYVVQRHMYDAVMKLDHRNNYSVVWEESVRTDEVSVPNPHDMVRHGDYLYISFYNDGRIVQANLNPLHGDGFLTGLEVRVNPPTWDGSSAELSQMKIVDDILYVGAEGLNDSWNCGSRSDGSPNRSRIYAFHPETLTPAPVFEDGQTWKELSFCNMRNWLDLPDGRTLIYSLGNYRQYGADENDGGIEIVDLRTPTAPPEIQAFEGDFGPYDIFGVFAHNHELYVTLVGELAIPIYLHKLDTSTPGEWKLDGDALYEGNIWGMVGWGDELFAVERDTGFEGVVRIDPAAGGSTAPPILTAIAPETLTLFHRLDGCW